MENELSLREKIYAIPTENSEVRMVNAYIKSGELAREYKYYDLAYHCFGCVAGIFEEKGLGKLIGKKYYSLAGDMAKLARGSIYSQEAGLAYGRAGDKDKLEAHLKNLGYEEKDISPSSWMDFARFLAEKNQGGEK